MSKRISFSSKTHLFAVLQALFVTFLWSSSTVLIKFGLQGGLPALTFAGIRYCIAFVSLITVVLINPIRRRALSSIPRRTWFQLALLGILFYTLTQGAHFFGLVYLPVNMLSLIYNFATIIVAIAGKRLMREAPTATQWVGILLSIIAAGLFFFPFVYTPEQLPGLFIAFVGMLAYSASSLLGRHVNLYSNLPPVLVTTISMGIGGVFLMSLGGVTQGFGTITPVQWLIIVWLALVNTALAFTLWNKTQRTLRAVESSVINNTILPQASILAWIFLSESLNVKQITAIILTMIAAFLVQLPHFSLKSAPETDNPET